jgi:sterol desaturase/sphingolipid hydroxylase (fatty acid hydroxylase superfamily)
VFTVLGLSLEGAAMYTFFTAIGEFFYHTNVRTPRWVGFVFQRPEMHRIHHRHGQHKNNYGDITWWDMLFGTYDNPKEWTAACGFDPDMEERLGAMLAFRDVHQPPSRGDAVKAPAEHTLVLAESHGELFRENVKN